MKIALLTCERLPELLPSDQLLVPKLAANGISAKAVIWDDPDVEWETFDYLIFRNTWDYFEKESAFDNWLGHLEHIGARTFNALHIIRQNKHKFYLRQMRDNGIPILPTVFIPRTTDLDLSKLMLKDWKRAVIKPAFSAGSYMTEAFDTSETEAVNKRYKSLAVAKDFLLQKFMPEIQTLGETSLIFFNKSFSHCVNKIPATGDFRVQVQFGGQYQLTQPSQSVIEQAQKIVDGFDGDLLYARVDGIIIDDTLHLMEVECIEPDLYFNLKEGAREMFVEQIVELTKSI